MASIAVENIHKSFSKEDANVEKVLSGVTFSTNDQEFVCLLGPSGCGKTTILNIIAGLITDYAGKLTISNDLTKKNRIGYVFQTPRLLNWMNLRDNIMFALNSKKENTKEYIKIADEYLTLVGLGGSGEKYPLFCSEGEKARAGIARASIGAGGRSGQQSPRARCCDQRPYR